jgi:hypothetical protein
MFKSFIGANKALVILNELIVVLAEGIDRVGKGVNEVRESLDFIDDIRQCSRLCRVNVGGWWRECGMTVTARRS